MASTSQRDEPDYTSVHGSPELLGAACSTALSFNPLTSCLSILAVQIFPSKLFCPIRRKLAEILFDKGNACQFTIREEASEFDDRSLKEVKLLRKVIWVS